MPRRRNGNIARLPNALRNRINHMILDGLPYADIIKSLGRKGAGLIAQNFSNWRTGGYKDWLEDNEHSEHLRNIRATCVRIVKENDGNEVQEAALKVAATHIYELLRKFDPAVLKKSFKGDPDDYARIIRTLFQISGGGLKHEHYRAKVAECKAVLEKELKRARNKGGLSPETLRAIEQQVGLL